VPAGTTGLEIAVQPGRLVIIIQKTPASAAVFTLSPLVLIRLLYL
jgi:hypothetical protein